MDKNKWKKIITISSFIFIGAIGFTFAFITTKYTAINNGVNKTIFDVILEVLILFSCIFIQIIIHETGHLVFGLISGYKFVSFRIFSFMWVKEKEKIKFKRLSIEGTGGQCLMSPPDFVDGKIPVILYNFGGSIMNIIASIIAFMLYFIIGYTSFLSMFSVVGIVLAIMNGIPIRMGMVNNDGYNAFSLTRNNIALYSFWVQLKVNDEISKGNRLKDMPDEWFVVPKDEEMKNSMVSVIGVFACNRLMDKHDLEEANKLMIHLLGVDSGMADIHRKLIVCDRIYCELIDGNIEKASELFSKGQKKFMKAMKKFPAVLRTEYAYSLIAERNNEKAKNIKKEFEKYACYYPYTGDIESERELIEIVDEYFESDLNG